MNKAARPTMLVMLSTAILVLVLLTACGSENRNALSENDGLVYEDINDTTVDEFLIEAEIQPPTYTAFEADDELSITTYFSRIDFDAIDFASMIMPISASHGYIGHWYVRHISTYLPSRVPFTYRELDAALWLEQMLLAKGFNEPQVRLQTFAYYDVLDWEDYFGWGVPSGRHAVKQQGWHEGHEMREYSQNIIVTIPGQSAQTIIIGAHYDSLRYSGASDNASGTALLLESAQRMLAKDSYYTLVYVFFGAHEVGLLGTFYFYESLSPEERESIVLYINADVLIEGPDLLVSSGYNFRLSANAISERASSIAESFYNSHQIIFHQPHITGGDQLLFLYKGHTTLAFWGAEFYPIFNTNFLHSHRDSYEYISNRFPGMIERAMNAFALLLEAVLLDIKYSN